MLQEMFHSVRTLFGYSPTINRENIWDMTMKPPPQGIRQGYLAAREIWDIVSNPLLNSLRKSGFVAALKCYISKESFIFVGYWFVENSTIIQVSPSPLTPKNETVRLAQDILDLFSETEISIRWQLSTSKTNLYILKFLLDTAGKWRLSEHSPDLTIKYWDIRIPIQWLSPSQDSRILWVWVAPNGSSQEHTAQLRKITTSWANRFRSSHTRRENAWHYFQTTIKKSINHPLMVITMSKSQRSQVESPALSTALQASGLPLNFQIDTLAGPSYQLGFNHVKFYYTQGSKHICALIILVSQTTLQEDKSETPSRFTNKELDAEVIYYRITYLYWNSA